MQIQELNKEQQKAVNHIDGPMLVLAGAGSGKTKVLTNRIANLIENGISPYNILAITFTNKAAKEMKDRVVRLIGKEAYNIQISTFHSLGLKILKENYSMLGYEKNFTIIDSDDVLTIIKKILKDKNMSKDRYIPFLSFPFHSFLSCLLILIENFFRHKKFLLHIEPQEPGSEIRVEISKHGYETKEEVITSLYEFNTLAL